MASRPSAISVMLPALACAMNWRSWSFRDDASIGCCTTNTGEVIPVEVASCDDVVGIVLKSSHVGRALLRWTGPGVSIVQDKEPIKCRKKSCHNPQERHPEPAADPVDCS